jgi:hypothetical protein
MKLGRRGRVEVVEEYKWKLGGLVLSTTCTDTQVSASKHGCLHGKLRMWVRPALI